MARHKIAILVGSLRKDSVNRKVGRSICSFSSDKLDCNIIEIRNCRLTTRNSDANPPTEFVRFREQIAAVDGVLFARPSIIAGSLGC